VSSCSYMHQAVYVPPGRAVEIREPVLLPVWVRVKDGMVRGYAQAQSGWRAGPPPVIGEKE